MTASGAARSPRGQGARVSWAGLAAAVATGALSCAEAPLTAPQSPRGVVHVSIERADPSVELYRELGEKKSFLCSAPCEETIDARIGGEYVLYKRGTPFGGGERLDDRRGHVIFTVWRPPSRGLRVGGIVTTSVSGLGMVAGALMMGFIEGPGAVLALPGLISLCVNAATLPVGVVMIKLGRGSYDMEVAPMFVAAPSLPDLPPGVPAAGVLGGLRGTF